MGRALHFAAATLRSLADGEDVSRSESARMMEELLSQSFEGKNDFVLGSFLGMLQQKSPTDAELAGMIDAMETIADDDSMHISVPGGRAIAAVGSGKDQLKTINVTTAASLVAACRGAHVAKVGCGAESSVAGTTDVLDLLGLDTSMSHRVAMSLLEEHGFGFFNPEMPLEPLFDVYVGKSPIFNPLENVLPLFLGIDVDCLLYGLSHDSTERTARLLAERGYEGSLVVTGRTEAGERFDELSSVGPSMASRVIDDGVRTREFEPADFRVPAADGADISQPETKRGCADAVRNVLRGRAPDAHRNLVAVNAGALLWMSGEADDVEAGTATALDAIDRGEPWERFERIRANAERL